MGADSPPTSLTLLNQLQRPHNGAAWERFVSLYAPLLRGWARARARDAASADDLVQTVFLKLQTALPKYRREDGKAFRSWLWTVTQNAARDFARGRATGALPTADGLTDVIDDPPPDFDELEHRRFVVNRALALVRPEISAQTWAAFAGCKHVRALHIDITNLGSGLEHFRDCTELEVFHAVRSHVRDEHLAHLKNCTKLQVAELGGCGALTDSGLAHLTAKGLKRLNLNGTGVTNAGLARFADCKGLIRLEVEATRVTDAGLEPFRDHTGFELLKLEGLPLTDAVLEWVAKNENLTYLNLNASSVTDVGLARLHGLKRLTELYLGKTKVTAPGVAALTKALPNCKIVWDGPVLPAGAFGRAEFPTSTRVAQIGTHERRHRAHIEHLDAVPQWNRIATVAPDGLKVWELSTLKLVAEVVRLDEKQPLPAACALVGPNAVAVLDRDGATGLTVYDVSQRPVKVLRRLTIEPSNFPRDLAASPNREWVAFAHNEQVELWKPADLLAESGKPAHLISGEPTDKEFSWRRDMMRFAPDGTRFAFKIAEAVRTFALANGRWAEGATVPTEGSFVSFVFGPRNESLLVSYASERHKAQVCE